MANKKYEYGHTFQEWRAIVSSELKKMGFQNTKEAFFEYLHDYTDLLTYKLKLNGGFTTTNKHIFMQYSWQQLYEILY